MTGLGEESAKAMADGISRTGPPQATQNCKENFYYVQAPLSRPCRPIGKWLFYDAQGSRLLPNSSLRAVEMSGACALRFRSIARA